MTNVFPMVPGQVRYFLGQLSLAGHPEYVPEKPPAKLSVVETHEEGAAQ